MKPNMIRLPDILWATGACLFIRTAVYKEIGGLDAGFFCPSGGDRYVLAVTFAGVSAGMYAPIGRLSCRRGDFAGGESPQDFPQLPQ